MSLNKEVGLDDVMQIIAEKTARMYCTVSSISEVTAVILCAVTISLPLKKVLQMMM